jgi:hypothetical protein
MGGCCHGALDAQPLNDNMVIEHVCVVVVGSRDQLSESVSSRDH